MMMSSSGTQEAIQSRAASSRTKHIQAQSVVDDQNRKDTRGMQKTEMDSKRGPVAIASVWLSRVRERDRIIQTVIATLATGIHAG